MSEACEGPVCITCSDQLLRAVIVDVDASGAFARAHVDGTEQTISVELIENGVAPGDELLVHGGVALQRVPGTGA